MHERSDSVSSLSDGRSKRHEYGQHSEWSVIRIPLFGRIAIAFVGFGLLMIPQILWLSSSKVVSELGRPFEKPCDNVTAVPAKSRAAKSFVDITDQVGLDFQHVAGPLGSYFMPEVNGTGGAFFDYDSDGDLDIYLINAGRSPEAAGDFPPGTRIENRMFRQEANGHFSDVTEESGLGDTGFGSGCAIGDIDNDGDLDVYVTNYGPDRLYQNHGNGTFRDITQSASIDESDPGTGAVFFDYDRDGRLDLFVTNYVSDPAHGLSVACEYGEGRVSYCGPLMFSATADRLWHNEGVQTDGNGNSSVAFADVTVKAGMAETKGAGFTAVSADFDRDGWPDIYVANDMYPNRLWINGANGTFSDQGHLRGVALNGKGAAEASMGTAIGDVNGDATFDLLATNFTHEADALYLNAGDGMFVDGTQVSGLGDLTLPHTGWGAAFLDLDLDQDLDLVLANGLVTPCEWLISSRLPRHIASKVFVPDSATFWAPYADRNLLLVNDGRGLFHDQSDFGGDFTSDMGSARSLIYGDIDEDGDPDLLVTYCGGRARLFRNDIPKRGHWLKVRAIDPRLHRDAYGAEVTVTVGDRRLIRLLNPASGYLGSNDPRPHFGLGDSAEFDAIHVLWPDGLSEDFPNGPGDRMIVLRRGEGRNSELE